MSLQVLKEEKDCWEEMQASFSCISINLALWPSYLSVMKSVLGFGLATSSVSWVFLCVIKPHFHYQLRLLFPVCFMCSNILHCPSFLRVQTISVYFVVLSQSLSLCRSCFLISSLYLLSLLLPVPAVRQSQLTSTASILHSCCAVVYRWLYLDGREWGQFLWDIVKRTWS